MSQLRCALISAAVRCSTLPEPRVVATDLDGTIVRSDGTISARTRAALATVEQAGALVVLVTGRPPRWLADIADATGHRGIAICANGAVQYDLHTEQIVDADPLPADQVHAITQALRAAIPGLHFAVEGETGFGHEANYRSRWPTGPDTAVGTIDELVTRPVLKLLGRHPDMDSDDLLAAAQEVIAADVATLTHSSRDGLVEISPAGVTKATALARLCHAHGLGAADVLAFGDMPNDLAMLSWAGRSVAVANAHPDVLAAADEVTASNDDDGVALVLEREFEGSVS